MRDHALIGKFVGFWPIEKALQGWIAAKWKPKGHVTLQLGPKGFFTVTFICFEDRNRVMDEGPYFFNSAGLYLRDWIERFNPDKEDLSWAPVWIRLYSLPLEYWDEDSLKDIGNALGEFVKIAEETKMRRYTSYAHICVCMRLDKPLPDSVSLYHDDFEWVQPLDFEHVPFRCRKCHAIGHLFRDCPLNSHPTPSSPLNPSDQEGFTKVTNRRRANKKTSNGKKPMQPGASAPSTSNSFDILGTNMTEPPPNSEPITQKNSSTPPSPPSDHPSSIPPSQENCPATSSEPPKDPDWKPNGMDVDCIPSHSMLSSLLPTESNLPQHMEEEPESIDLKGLDIFGMQQACKRKDYDKIPEFQLNALEVVISRAYQQQQLGIQPDRKSVV